MKKLNICYLTQQYGNYISGTGTYSTNLINSIIDKEHSATIICPRENKREFANPKINLIEIERKNWDPSHGNWFTLSFQFSRELKKLLKQNNFDIIHFTDAREYFWTNLFYRKKSSSVIIGTMHDYTFMEANRNPFFYESLYNDWIKRYFYYNFVKYTEKSCLKSLDHLISVSESIKEKLEDSYKIDDKKISVIYNSIFLKNDLDKINNKKKREQIILIVGNNLQRKGIVTLFKAFAKLQSKYPNLKILAIGQDINKKYLENLTKDMGIEKKVEFVNTKPNKYILEKMREASLYVMPSLREGFGITFLEAMACETPVIGGSVGGTKELIKNGENGFLVNPEDYNDLADKISIILDDDLTRKKFIKNGLETVKSFSVEKMVDETLKVYMSISEHNEKR